MADPVQTTSTGLQYSGNPDFRGYLAAVDPALLAIVGAGSSGNDYTSFGINGPAETSYAKTNNGGDTQDITEEIQNLFDTYSGLVGGSPSATADDSSSTGSSGSSSSSSYANPTAAALYGNLATEYGNEVTSLENDEPTLESNIDNAYNTSVSEQDQQEGNEQNTNDQQRQGTLGTIDQNGNTTYNALMALLGSAGAAGSSAATFGVPQAVGNTTNVATNGANSTYAENENTIQETNQNALQSLLSQKNTNLANALAGLNAQEQTDVQEAQGDVANESYYGGTPNATLDTSLNTDSSSIQNQLSQIFSQYATPTYSAPAAPTLASYTTPTTPTITTPSASTPTSASAFLPYLTASGQNNNILTGANTTPAPTPAPSGGTS